MEWEFRLTNRTQLQNTTARLAGMLFIISGSAVLAALYYAIVAARQFGDR